MKKVFGLLSISILLFQVLTTTVSAKEPKQKSFTEWCEETKSLETNISNKDRGLLTRKTVSILLEVANTTDCELADSKLKSMDKITLKEKQIVDLEPLTSLTNLKSLDLGENKIVDLNPLASLTNLTALNLIENEIVDLKPLTALTNLKSINLSKNEIVDLNPLTNLTNLTGLALSMNKIVDLKPLANLTNLTILHLSKNEIVDLKPLANLTNLTGLDITENRILDLTPLASLTNLKNFRNEKQIIAPNPVGATVVENPVTSMKDIKDSSEEREIGLLFNAKNNPNPNDPQNTIFLVGTKFVGPCPAFDVHEGNARFFSKTKKPADNLRVIVRNVTFGFSGNEKPNIDREYYNGDASEEFNVRFGDSHSSKYLAVKPGLNKFEYVIKDGDTIVDSGEFSIKIDTKVSILPRNMCMRS